MKKKLPSLKKKNKLNTKKLMLSMIFIVIIFTLLYFNFFDGNLSDLMGNSVINGYICPDGYKLNGNMCISELQATKLGDVNDDGSITFEDINLITSHTNNTMLLTSQNFAAADVNKDGKITNKDSDKIKKYITIKDKSLNSYVCPDGYKLKNKKCTLEKRAEKIKKTDPYEVGDAVLYNNEYWYVLSNNDDYITVLKDKPLTASELGKYAINNGEDYGNIMYYNNNCTNNNDCNNYNKSDIKIVLDSYIVSINDDLKEVNGYKIRLITLDELVNLGFKDNTNTLYYEMNDTTPFWIGSNGGEYWVMPSNNINNNTFVVSDYNNNSYVYESSTDNTLALVRPVINLKKSAIK